jgi:cell division septation protein DedD
MRDYEEKSYYEIQLDNKQLILVFLAAVTVCALIFVLGVMVGKGQKEAELATVAKPETTLAQAEPNASQPQEPKSEEVSPPIKERKQEKRESKPDADVRNPEKTSDQYTFYDLDKNDEKTKEDEPVKQKAAAVKPSTEKAEKPTEKAEKPAEPVDEQPKSSSKSSDSGKYTIQILATPSRSRADERIKFLKSKGYSPFLDEHKTDNGSVYRVRVGRFADDTTAKALATKMKTELKLEPWVTTLE